MGLRIILGFRVDELKDYLGIQGLWVSDLRFMGLGIRVEGFR